MLLTFLCLIYEQEQELPNQRSTLYGRALDILLRDWSAEKRLERSSIYKHLRPEVEKELLSEIAYTSFEEDRLFFLKSDITDRLDAYLADTINIPAELDGPAVLHAIESEQGILVERATDTYSFSHLTLQEYLTALYIKEEALIETLVGQHLLDERWREVFLLVSGLMGRRGYELLEAIDQQARTYISAQPKVRHLIQWAGEVTQGSPAEYDDFEKIAIAIAVSLAFTKNSSIDLTIALTSTGNRGLYIAATITSDKSSFGISPSHINNDAIVNYLNKPKVFNTPTFKELPNQLKTLKEKVPKSSATDEEWLEYIGKIQGTWFNALELKKEKLSLSEKEWKCFADYLYANELLLCCQQSSIGISRKAWEALKSRLLTID